ncbi:MAG TPA: citrate (Si)-synthase, partial [Planctomycetaceae bacterium]|nr:citrate (Si)-synthase [Planctomycetaceae bacterium]
MSNAKLILEGKEYELPVVKGTEGEIAIDITKLRAQTGAITLDSGYGNTGSCKSAICFINGEKGVLHYRGYPIEELAENCSFPEVAYLVIYGELPTKQQLEEFETNLRQHSLIREDMKKFYEGYPPTAHPMAILSAMIGSLSTYYPSGDGEDLDLNIVRLLAKAPTIAAYAYKKTIGQPFMYPRNDLNYS